MQAFDAAECRRSAGPATGSFLRHRRVTWPSGSTATPQAARTLSRVNDPLRCARPLCGAPAVARLTYDHAGATAWLDELGAEGGWSLCVRHADSLRVPVGWVCHDRRPASAASSPPAPAPTQPVNHYRHQDRLAG